ncbi:MAG: DUF6273 domain-containing protein [Elusimicrobiales bacterium]|nr:DUF6273 domain-containing protein [Elusimicrobiales bacterium]
MKKIILMFILMAAVPASAQEIGDVLKFGSYPYKESGARKKIEWTVIHKDYNGNLLLISRQCLDAMPFHKKITGITWQKSSLRTWLNKDFIKAAFTLEERKKIQNFRVENTRNMRFGTLGGNNTHDKIFLLSDSEANMYMPYPADRLAEPTPYAKSRGAKTHEDGRAFWWLRTPGSVQSMASGINHNGELYYEALNVNNDHGAVRPAMVINSVNFNAIKESYSKKNRKIHGTEGDSSVNPHVTKPK